MMMEAARTLLLVALAMLAVAVAQSDAIERTQIKYMSLPSRRSFGQMNSNRLIEALEVLNVPDEAAPEEVKSRLDWGAENIKNVDYVNQYRVLQPLTNDDGLCRQDLINSIKHIVHLINDNPQIIKQEWLTFFLFYGKEKFMRCASVEIGYYLSEADPREERALDDYFKTAMGVSREIDDKALLEKLKKFSFTRSEIDIEPLVNMAKWSKSKKSDTNEVLLERLTSGRCKPFSQGTNNIHDMLALAKVFGGELEVPTKFSKMTEYRRLCLAFTSRKDEVMANFRKFLPQEKVKTSFFSKFNCMSKDCVDVDMPGKRV